MVLAYFTSFPTYPLYFFPLPPPLPPTRSLSN